MALRVHFLSEPEAGAFAVLQERLVSGISCNWGSDIPVPADYHVLVTGRPGREFLIASPVLHTLIIPFAGVPEVTRELMKEFPHIAVHNLHHNAAPTAEMAMALLLAAAKFILPYDRALRRDDWTPRYQPSPVQLLEGKTVLIIGFGKIGRRIARACWALGMKVLAIRRHPERSGTPDFPVKMHALADLMDLLPCTHVLVLALPATHETEGLIGETELGRITPGGILVNVARGSIVDQAALYHALQKRHLAAAGLDVWYQYPTDEASRASTPPADFPFRELDNVVMSPHRAGSADSTEFLRMTHLANLLNAAATQKPLANKVDLEAGY